MTRRDAVTTIDLAALRALVEKATPLPYVKCALMQATTRDGRELPCRDQYSLRAHYRVPCTAEESAVAPFDFAHGMTEQDAAFVVAACNALPSLLAFVSEAVELLAAARFMRGEDIHSRDELLARVRPVKEAQS